jgi:hypothetical protein
MSENQIKGLQDTKWNMNREEAVKINLQEKTCRLLDIQGYRKKTNTYRVGR